MIDPIKVGVILNSFQEASLTEINGVHLMERKDTKFVFKTSVFLDILGELKPNYKVLTIENRKVHPYSTIYYDTDDLMMYNQHQNGKLNRFKLRFRSYDDFKTTYLELKFKSNKQETIKKRIAIPNRNEMSPDALTLIESETSLKFSRFHETLTNKFCRITLVNNEFTERLTLDFNLVFQNETQHIECFSIVIAELKQDKLSSLSKFTSTMKFVGIRQLGISKYCIGMMLLNPRLKSNNFKPKILQIQKLSNNFN